MKLTNELFEVIETRVIDTEFSNTINLNPDHIIYTGHFPGHPVTPGVIQLQIVHELIEKHFSQTIKLISISRSKFLKVLDPNETPQIMIHIKFILTGELLNIEARGENGKAIFFKLNSEYQFIGLDL